MNKQGTHLDNLAEKYFNVAEVMLVVINADQTVERINGKGCNILGYKEKDIIGKNWFDNFLPEALRKDVKEVFDKLVKGKVDLVEYYENPVLTKSGEEKIIAWHNTVLKDEKGKIVCTISSGEDITGRKKAEQQLSEFKFISDNANDAHYLSGRDAMFHYVNETACTMMGYAEKELVNLGVPDVDELYDISKYQELFDMAQKETVPPFESINRRKDGTTFPSEITVSGYQIEGRPYMFAALRDITERKKTEDELKLKSKVTEQVNAPMMTTGLDFRINWVNQAFSDQYGYSSDEIIGQTPDFLNVEPLSDEIQKDIYQTVSSGEIWTRELKNRKKDGTTFLCKLKVFPLKDDNGKIFAYAGHQHDITERRMAEEALKNSEETLRLAQEVSHIGSWDWDIGTNELHWSKEVYDIFLIDPDKGNPQFMDFIDMVHPDDADFVSKAIEEAVKEQKGFDIEYRIIRNDKTVRSVHAKGRAFYDDKSGPFRMLGMIYDTTERKAQEDLIRQAKYDWEDIFNSITDIITIHDLDFNIVRYNRAAEKLLGLPLLKDVHVKCHKFYHGIDSPPENCPSCECLKTKNAAIFETFEPYLNKFIEIRAIPRFDENSQLSGLIHVVRDITERKRIEEEVLSVSKFPSENPNPVVRISSDKDITYMNESFTKLLIDEGISEKDALKILPDNLYTLIDIALEVGKPHIMLEAKVADKVISYNIIPIVEQRYVNLYGRDITDRKLAEKELKKRVDDLEKFYDMAVGREVKMKELKTELKALKVRLSKFEAD